MLNKGLYICSLILVLLGCRKDDSAVDALISISSPAEGTEFEYGDTISVTGNVKSDEDHYNITISIEDENGKKIFSSQSFSGSKNTNFSADFILSDSNLNTRELFILVAASVDGSIIRKYRQIKYSNTFVSSTNWHFVTSTGSLDYHLNTLNSDLTVKLIRSFNGNFFSGSITSNSTFVAVPYNSELFYYNVIQNQITDSKSLVEFSQLVATGKDKDKIYISGSNGLVKGYENGNVMLNVNLTDNYLAKGIYGINDTVVLYKENISQQKKLVVYYRPTSNDLMETFITGAVKNIFNETTSKKLVLSNENGEAKISSYDFTTNSLTYLNKIAGDTIISSVKLGQAVYISTSSRVYKYFPSTNIISIWLSSPASKLFIDERAQLIVAYDSQSNLSFYDELGTKKGMVNIPSLKDFYSN